MEEIFKDVPNYISLYKVSNLGRIYSSHRNRFLKGSKLGGYIEISLWNKEGEKWRQRIHRIMYFTFIEPITSNDLIHHCDDNKLNNTLSNLEKVTRSRHKVIHSIIGESTRFKNKWQHLNPSTIINDYNTLSTSQIAKKYGCSQKTIERLIKKHGEGCVNKYKHMITHRI